MKKLTFTLIIPIYNRELFLPKLFDNLCAQISRRDDVDLLLVNDGSKDKSKEICEKYMKKYSFISLIDKKQNEGLVAAVVSGINAAQGNYILFVDSDDIVSNDYIEKLVSPFYVYEDLDFVTALKTNTRGEKDSFYVESGYYDAEKYRKFILPNVIHSTSWKNHSVVKWSRCAKAIKKDLIKEQLHYYKNAPDFSEDSIFVLILCLNAKTCFLVNEEIYTVVIHEGQMQKVSISYNKYYENVVHLFTLHLQALNDFNQLDIDTQAYVQYFCFCLNLIQMPKYKKTKWKEYHTTIKKIAKDESFVKGYHAIIDKPFKAKSQYRFIKLHLSWLYYLGCKIRYLTKCLYSKIKK